MNISEKREIDFDRLCCRICGRDLVFATASAHIRSCITFCEYLARRFNGQSLVSELTDKRHHKPA